MAEKSIGEMIASLSADTSKFRSEMNRAKDHAQGTSLSISTAFENIEKKARSSAGSVGRIGSAVRQLGGEFGGASGKIASFGQQLLSAVGGGPMMMAVTGVTLAVGVLAKNIQDAKRAAEEARKAQVDAWQASTKEIAKANDELREQLRLKELLFGLDAPGARNARQAEQAVEDARITRDTLLARQERIQSVSRSDRGEFRRLVERWGNIPEQLKDAEAILRDAERELEVAKFIAAQENQPKGGGGGFTSLGIDINNPGAGGAKGSGSGSESGGFRVTDANDRARAAQAAAARAFAIRQNQYDTLIKKAQILGDKEGEIEQGKLKALDALAQKRKEYDPATYAEARKQVEQEADDAITEHRRAQAQQIRDIEIEIRSDRAKATETQVDDLQVAMEKEVAAVQDAVAKKVIAEEWGAARIAAIRESYSVRMARTEKEEGDRTQEEIDRKILNQQRMTGQAMAVGFAAGGALIAGIRGAIEQGDTRALFKGVLAAAAGIFSVAMPGIGSGIAAGLGMVSGFFAQGGLIGGVGGPTEDKNLAFVSPGEFITRASTVSKFGSAFMERLNEGVVDLSLIRRYATGGMIGASAGGFAMAGTGGVRGGTTSIYVSAFDPASSVEALAKVYEPAAVSRGLAYSDARTVSLARRQARAPRSGR